MKFKEVSSLIFIFFLVGCGSIPISVSTPAQTRPASTITPISTNTFQPTEIFNFLPTPTSTIPPTSNISEITIGLEDNRITLKGFRNPIYWLFWSKDDEMLFIGTSREFIVYDMANKKITVNLEFDYFTQSFALSRDEQILAIYNENHVIRLVNPRTGNILKTIYAMPYFPALSLSPNGKTLAFVGNEGQIILLDTSTGKEITQLPDGVYGIGYLSFSPDGNWLMASSSTDYSFRVWETNSWELQRTFYCDFFAFVFNPNGKEFVTYRAGFIDDRNGIKKENGVWDFASGKKLFNLSSDLPQTPAVAYDSKSNYITVGGTIYDANTGKYLRQFTGSGQVTSLTFNSAGTKLAIALDVDNLGEIVTWDISQP